MTNILDLLFPKKCVNCDKLGSYVCSACFVKINIYTEVICPMCMKRSVIGVTHPSCHKKNGLDGLIACFEYKGPIKKLLFKYKYSPYIRDLSKIISRFIVESLHENQLFFKNLDNNALFVPVPLSYKRLQKRGYNQSALIGKYVAQYFNRKFIDGLERIKNTDPQFKLSKEERLLNLKNAFKVKTKLKSDFAGKSVFLVDDIATSCSTLKECAKVLKIEAKADKVTGLVLARET